MAQGTLPDRAEVVVVGGGIIGTSTAYFLTYRTDKEVVLLEKDKIAAGSTGDSSAILRHHYGSQEIYTRMAWWSHQFFQAFEEETNEPISYAKNPQVRFATEGTDDAEYARDGYETLSALDIPVEWYDGKGLCERFPQIVVDSFDFAVSDVTAGYSDGSDAANGFARAAARRGATIVTDVEVESVRTRDSHITGVETTAGSLTCETVVLAAGPWTPRLLEGFDLEIPLVTTREQVVVLEPPAEYTAGNLSPVPTTDLPGGDWYIRPDFGDGILVATHHTGEEVDPDVYDQNIDESTILDIVDALSTFAPDLARAKIKGDYCGVYSTTPDHDFIVDQVYPGCYLACGFSGHGFKHGPAIGRILTDFVETGETDFVDTDIFALDRFEDKPRENRTHTKFD